MSKGDKGGFAISTFLEVRSLSKSYPGVKALDRISLSIFSNQIHALVGENGAGKSILIKILAGVVPADTGQILIDGNPVSVRSAKQARHLGISVRAKARPIPGFRKLISSSGRALLA